MRSSKGENFSIIAGRFLWGEGEELLIDEFNPWSFPHTFFKILFSVNVFSHHNLTTEYTKCDTLHVVYWGDDTYLKIISCWWFAVVFLYKIVNCSDSLSWFQSEYHVISYHMTAVSKCLSSLTRLRIPLISLQLTADYSLPKPVILNMYNH